jgi:hypothetical protein
MPDGPLRRYDQTALGAHANLDDVACVHGRILKANNLIVVPAKPTGRAMRARSQAPREPGSRAITVDAAQS